VELTYDEMWGAVIHNNTDYDGRFFYAVKTTGIVCRPSCKSKNPLRENVYYFFQLPHALEGGFRSCKRCRPDLIKPPHEGEVINQAVEIIKKEYMTDLTLKILAHKVGMSPFHFQRLFKKEEGLTPTSFIADCRLKKSIDFLKETDWTITKIAHEVGYQSTSYFSYCFRKKWAFSPSAYRRLHKKEIMEDSR
jgi:AraC family transcriptional regulator, regulatory protein of adaptative response / methylphosphotriester-DNA alkyltransferase methyltransferase